MATANYTAITTEQINASLGRETFYGEQGTVYLSKHSDDSFMTSAGEVIFTSQAFDLIADGKVSGMNDVAEEAIKAALIEQEAVKAEESSQSSYSRPGNSISATVHDVERVKSESKHPSKGKENTPSNVGFCFNYRNLQNLVSDGSIFYVEFIKRSTGTLRKMKCRTGVKKHLRGGTKGYSSAAKGLLTVFDMEAKGYRSIPIEAIKRLSVGGQSFDYAGV